MTNPGYDIGECQKTFRPSLKAPGRVEKILTSAKSEQTSHCATMPTLSDIGSATPIPPLHHIPFPTPLHPIPSHPNPSHLHLLDHLPHHSIPSHLLPQHTFPSHPVSTLYHPISSCPVPSHPNPFHFIPSRSPPRTGQPVYGILITVT